MFIGMGIAAMGIEYDLQCLECYDEDWASSTLLTNNHTSLILPPKLPHIAPNIKQQEYG